MREQAACVVHNASAYPEFTAAIIAGGGLQKLYSQVTDSRMSAISPVTAKPMYSYAVGAYCNALSYTTRPQDVLMAIQNNGMEIVNSFMGSSHREVKGGQGGGDGSCRRS